MCERQAVRYQIVNIIPNIQLLMQTPRYLLAVDFFGAIATSLATTFLLASGRMPTGLPTWLLYSLAMVALGFACFDAAAISQFFDARIALATIAYLNLSYCVAVLVVLCVCRREATQLCLFYFCVELAIVIPLAYWELTISKKPFAGL